jgi:hypothetical protein
MHEGGCKPLKERAHRQRRKTGNETRSRPAPFGDGQEAGYFGRHQVLSERMSARRASVPLVAGALERILNEGAGTLRGSARELLFD